MGSGQANRQPLERDWLEPGSPSLGEQAHRRLRQLRGTARAVTLEAGHSRFEFSFRPGHHG
jgi:hypothetical protein